MRLIRMGRVILATLACLVSIINWVAGDVPVVPGAHGGYYRTPSLEGLDFTVAGGDFPTMLRCRTGLRSGDAGNAS